MPLLAFLVAVVYLPLGVFPSGAELGRWSLLSLGAAVVLWSRKDTQGPGWAGWAFLLWCAAGLLWSIDPLTTMGGFVQLYVLLVLLCAAPLDLGRTMTWMSAGVALSSAVAVWQWAHGTGEYSTGLFAGKNQAVEVAMPLAVWCLLSRRWPLALALVPLVVVSESKEVVAMALVAGGVTLMALHHPQFWAFEQKVFAALALTMSGLVVTLELFQYTDALGTLVERLTIWGDALSAWSVRPWGWGLGTFAWMFPIYEYTHNDLLQLLVETGPGAALLGGALIHLLFTSGRVPERAALAAIVASSFLWWPLHAPASAFLAAMLGGSILRSRRAELASRVAGRASVAPEGHDARGPLFGAPGCSLLVPDGFSSSPAAWSVSNPVQRSGGPTS